MRAARTLALIACVAVPTAAHAFVPRAAPRYDALEALPAAALAHPLRTHRELRFEPRTSPAWQRFAASGAWQAAWDAATGAPVRIWGRGPLVRGAVRSPDIASRAAAELLRAHLALFAPGAAPADFVLASNTTDGAIRSVGFAQRSGGRDVIGGQVSFRFERDHLVMIAAEALPNVPALPATPRAATRARAIAELRAALALPAAPVTPRDAEQILPLVTDAAVAGYRVVTPLVLDGAADGRYLGYADAATGALLAVQRLDSAAVGTVLYRGIDRNPMRPRVDRPAARAQLVIAGAPETAALDGTVTWADGVAMVATSVVGDLVAVTNRGTDPARATAQLSLAPDGTAAWDASAAPEADAQVQVYLAVMRAKAFVRASIDPTAAPALDEQLPANVNVAGTCNAFFDGTALNFFRASPQCQNAGLVEDIVIHEYGHRLHHAEILPGVGAFDAAMSEGAADFLAATLLDDPGVGRGFFYTDEPVRDLDPPAFENQWPRDIGEVHHTGVIFGGALWDLRTALVAQLGRTEGLALVHRLYVAALRRATDIPTTIFEVLAADDDDGDLANGTPHECAIRAAFGRHGLRLTTGSVTAEISGAVAHVHAALLGVDARCGADQIVSATLDWGASGALAAGSAAATLDASGATADLPLVPHEAIYYRMTFAFADGTSLALPDNRADPYYQLYTGATVPLYCTDFEGGDPFADGWTTGAADASGAAIPSPWTAGAPLAGATDPGTAASGARVLGLALGGDYAPDVESWVALPPLDVGAYSDVRLQYHRWLAVEDSARDRAEITVNGAPAWTNATEHLGASSALRHVDREWRFHDVAVSGRAPGHTLAIAWRLRADGDVQLGGWTLDDVCVVANPDSICGDGVRSETEACDDGAANADRADACRTWCALPACGDGITDAHEQCDDGAGGSERCSPSCELVDPPGDGGGCAAGGDARGAIVLLLAACAPIVRRRTLRR